MGGGENLAERSEVVATVWPRAIAHVDLDQFYAAVEILDFPELKGLPLIVGGLPGSRGVVCTASYEARKFGVHSAMGSTQASRLCPQATWRTPRMERYAEKSREVRKVFERYTDQIEPLSMDEAFMDLTGSIKLFGPPETIVRLIKEDIFRETGLVGSAGLAMNKFMAKIASDLRKPNGLVIVPPNQAACEALLAPLPVSRLWGVGPKTAERLKELNVLTVRDLAQMEPEFLARTLGKQAAEHLLLLSRGIDSRDVESGERPKSIGRENTFATDLFDREEMEKELLAFCDEVAATLRSKRFRCLGVTLKVKFPDFTRIARSATFDEATDVADTLYGAVVEMLRTKVNFNGQGIRLLGVSAHRLVTAEEMTPTLFPDEQALRLRRAAEATDRVRARFGAGALVRGRLLEGRSENTGTPGERLPE